MSESAAEAPAAGTPVEGGETGTSHELLQRLRELEAENSALAQANENQRETYERCLDEVANHVVQALLNQKDLREECIKLKKRVFDLERQNQTLSDLFQQKLQLSAGSLPQLPSHPPSAPADAPSSPQPGSTEQPPAPLPPACCAPPREATAEGPAGSPGLGPGSPSLAALSPFLKKKAQILEVLRRLEETDPLLGAPGPPEPRAAAPPPPPPPPSNALKPPGGPPRLSPQLARASKIPCRGGGPLPEASPVPSRRGSPEAPPAAEPPGTERPAAAAASPPGARRSAGGSSARRPGKKPPEPGYLPFKERLAALGKLRGAEGREPPGRPGAAGGGSLKPPEAVPAGEALARCYSSGSVGGKGRAGGGRPPAPPAKAARSPHGSPTKAPAKPPAGKAAAPRGDEPKAPKAPAAARKAPAGPEPPPAAAAGAAVAGAAGAAGHSAIEEKVMKGIEENVLRLQGQEKAPAGEVKPKAAGGLASWFGLRKSKLPALSRRAEAAKGRDWAGAPAPLRREVKLAARKLEAESLNISRLMEKAEDLRKALQEEQAFLHGLALEKGRPRARGGGGPPERERGPSQLQVMYQEVAAETFMQQLLNRVDGKDVSYESRLEHKRDLCDFQRVSPDAKDPRLLRPPRNGIVGHLRGCQEPPDKGPDLALRDELPSDESLSESGTSQHFPACGSLTRTLDSGIGTFPPPDYCGGAPAKSAPKPRGRPEAMAGAGPARPAALTKVPRKARTLEREVPSVEELLVPGKHQSMPAFHGVLACAEAPAGLPGRRGCPQDADASKPRRVQQSKNWTFPNAKACGTADPFLCAAGAPEGLYRPALAPAHGPGGRRGASPEAPPPLPPALSASSSRTPSASDVGDEGSPEARSRDAGQGPPGLEHSESLSDSLYDSLSSCGSQG
ncbi:nck-associated protein 5-like [Dromaius novaehollandiae]|uniref:nck-associated protein 5-like n=1 Tax=Dromaius novaehollandiae TaxID=8790 RepID=UPI00311F4339